VTKSNLRNLGGFLGKGSLVKKVLAC